MARKTPSQSRSKLTMSSILEATQDMLRTTSYDDISTKKIADKVGISVGSLYQYFPNKKTIALAIYEETTLEVAKQMRDQMYTDAMLSDDAVANDKNQGMYKTIEVSFNLYEEHQSILIDLLEDAPELKRHAATLTANNLLYNAARLFLRNHPPKVDVDLDATSFVMESLIFDSIKRYLLLPEPKPFPKEELIDIIASTIISYYQRIGVLGGE